MPSRIGFGAKKGSAGVAIRDGFKQLLEDVNTNTRFIRVLTGTGTQVAAASQVEFWVLKGSTATGVAALKIPWAGLQAVFSRNPSFTFSTSLLFGGASAAASTSTETYVTFGDISTGADATRRHFGFRFRNNNGAIQVYATSAAGTAQTATLITTPAVGSGHTFHCQVNSKKGTCAFYVDGVLVATHTTNVPVSGSLNSNVLVAFAQFGIAGTGADYHYMSTQVAAEWDAVAA